MTAVWPSSDPASSAQSPRTVAELEEMARCKAARDPTFNPEFKVPISLHPSSDAFKILARLVQ